MYVVLQAGNEFILALTQSELVLFHRNNGVKVLPYNVSTYIRKNVYK